MRRKHNDETLTEWRKWARGWNGIWQASSGTYQLQNLHGVLAGFDSLWLTQCLFSRLDSHCWPAQVRTASSMVARILRQSGCECSPQAVHIFNFRSKDHILGRSPSPLQGLGETLRNSESFEPQRVQPVPGSMAKTGKESHPARASIVVEDVFFLWAWACSASDAGKFTNVICCLETYEYRI